MRFWDSSALVPLLVSEDTSVRLELVETWHVVDPVETIRVSAKRFLRVHDLRAADALQLAAAFLASEGRPASLELSAWTTG